MELSRQGPIIHQRRTVARSRLFEVEQLDLEFSNGVCTQYERLVSRGNGAVLVVPLLDAETVLLIREFAAGTERYELAFPKGKLEAGEDVLDAANREIMEEVGYASRRLTRLAGLSLAPGYATHSTHLVLAEELYPQRAIGDEPEEIEVVPWKLDRISELMARDDFSEARSIAGLFIVLERLRNSL
jgi:ADP-ribose diphosphatase